VPRGARRPTITYPPVVVAQYAPETFDIGIEEFDAAAGEAIAPTMTASKPSLSPKLQAWVDARKRHHLSHAHVQMARELGMNPRKLGKLDNHKQEPWKAPLPQFIEQIYEKRFGRARPERVVPVEEHARQQAVKRSRMR
jgi:hypothetical protein